MAQIGYFSLNSCEGDEGGRLLARWSAAARCSASSPSIHSSLLQNSVLFDPIAFSGLNYKRVSAAYSLEREEVEVGEVVAWEVEVVPDPSVPVVSHGAPVLSASLSTGFVWLTFPTYCAGFLWQAPDP